MIQANKDFFYGINFAPYESSMNVLRKKEKERYIVKWKQMLY